MPRFFGMGYPFLGMQHRLYDVKATEVMPVGAHQFEVGEHVGGYGNLPGPRVGVHVPINAMPFQIGLTA